MDTTKTRSHFFSDLASVTDLFAIFDLIPDLSFFVKDRQGRFVFLNRRGCEYCGVANADDAIDKTDFDFFPRQRAEEYRDDDLDVMRSGEPILNRIESAPEGEGSPRLVITSKIPLRDKRGKVVGVAGFSRSVEQLSNAGNSVSSIANVVNHINQHFDQQLSSDRLADLVGLSATQLERRFRYAMGSSTRQYLIRVRIENATQMLAETDKPITEIAMACGFYDHAHFSKAFKRAMKVSPSEHRESKRFAVKRQSPVGKK